MAQINNKTLIQEIANSANIQISKDSIPNQLAEKVVPTMEVNPKLLRRSLTLGTLSSSATGSGVVIAANSFAGKPFFITGFQVSWFKDAVCDTATGSLNVTYTQDGTTKSLFIHPMITLTLQENVITQNFEFPLKCDAGTAVNLQSNAFTAGVLRRYITIYGYVDEG
jgi:hypothetical protein